jgi:beta-galactosidase
MNNALIIKILCFILFYILPESSLGQKQYLFSYFTGNGEDGLHLAYSQDGLQWQPISNGKSFLSPNVGKDKLMRDPCIIKGQDENYIMVWTTGWHDKIIGMATTKDFINWSAQKSIPVMEHEPIAKNAWAPEIFYNKNKKEYLIFWASTLPNKHKTILETENEKGWNHKIYATTTRDFKAFSETKLYFDPDFSVIDATIFKKKRKYVMILKNENPNPPEKNLRVSTSKNLSKGFNTKVSDKITGDYWAEGPTVIKIDSFYYVYFDKYKDHKYGCVRSKDLKQWEDVSDMVSFPLGLRHGTILEVPENIIVNLKKQ